MKIMSYEEAVEYFRGKFPMTSSEYETLVAEVGEYASSMAFTVSRIAAADLLQDLHGEILHAIEEGGTFWDFREGIDEIMTRRGWKGIDEPVRKLIESGTSLEDIRDRIFEVYADLDAADLEKLVRDALVTAALAGAADAANTPRRKR